MTRYRVIPPPEPEIVDEGGMSGRRFRVVAAPERPKTSRVESAMLGMQQGGAFGFRDEAEGFNAARQSVLPHWVNRIDDVTKLMNPVQYAGRGVVDAAGGLITEAVTHRDGAFRQAYEQRRDERRGRNQRAREDNPLTYGAGEIAGGLATAPVGAPLISGGARVAGAGARAITAPVARAVGNTSVGRGLATIGTNIASLPGVRPVGTFVGGALNAAGRGARDGAVYGAVYGFGAGEGDAEDRMRSATEGGIVGGAFGGALGVAARGASALYAGARETLGRAPGSRAAGAANRRMAADQVAPSEVLEQVYRRGGAATMADRIATARANGVPEEQIIAYVRQREATNPTRMMTQVEETLAELAGPGTQALARATANTSAGGGERAARTVARGQQLSQSLETDMGRALRQDAGDFYAGRQTAQANRSAGLGDAYESAYSAPRTPQVEARLTSALHDPMPAQPGNPNTAPLASRPRFQQIVEAVGRDAALDGDAVLAGELQAFQRALRAGQRPTLSTRAIDMLDRRARDLRMAADAGNEGYAASQYRAIQDALRTVDDVTGLGRVREQARTQINASEAADIGRQAWRAGTDVEEIAEAVRDMPEPVFEQYMLGVARAMSDQLRRQSNLGGLNNAARKLAGTQQMRDKLEAILPTTASGQLTAASRRFMERLQRTNDMAEFASTTFGGSRTAPLSQDIREAVRDTDTMSELFDTLGTHFEQGAGATGSRIGRFLTNVFRNPGVLDDRTNEAIGDLLFASGPAEVAEALEAIARFNAQNGTTIIPRIPERIMGMVAGIGAGSGAGANSDPQRYDAELVEVAGPIILQIGAERYFTDDAARAALDAQLDEIARLNPEAAAEVDAFRRTQQQSGQMNPGSSVYASPR